MELPRCLRVELYCFEGFCRCLRRQHHTTSRFYGGEFFFGLVVEGGSMERWFGQFTVHGRSVTCKILKMVNIIAVHNSKHVSPSFTFYHFNSGGFGSCQCFREQQLLVDSPTHSTAAKSDAKTLMDIDYLDDMKGHIYHMSRVKFF